MSSEWIVVSTEVTVEGVQGPFKVYYLTEKGYGIVRDVESKIRSLESRIDELEKTIRQQKVLDLLKENPNRTLVFIRNRVPKIGHWDLDELVSKGSLILERGKYRLKGAPE